MFKIKNIFIAFLVLLCLINFIYAADYNFKNIQDPCLTTTFSSESGLIIETDLDKIIKPSIFQKSEGIRYIPPIKDSFENLNFEQKSLITSSDDQISTSFSGSASVETEGVKNGGSSNNTKENFSNTQNMSDLIHIGKKHMPEKTANKLRVLNKKLEKFESFVTKYRKKAQEAENLWQTETDETKKAQLKKEFMKQKEMVREKCNHLQNCALEKAKLLEKIEESGDPVDVSTGRFSAKYNDYKAQDFLDLFSVNRYLTYGNAKESFGNNWICSLDSRIIRCNYKSFENDIKTCEEILETIKNIKVIYTDAAKIYDDIDSEILDLYKKALDSESEYIEILNKLKNLQNIYNEINDKNKYAAYGEFLDSEKYLGNENILIYLTEFGYQIVFAYAGNGIWETEIESAPKLLKFKNLNADGKYSGNTDCKGGYELIFEDGHKRIFSEYGILEKEIDRNNNETIYKSKNGLVYEIKLKTGEIIKVERNNKNYITSIKGEVSGNSYYFYSNDDLTKVINNKNIEIGFEYDKNKDLVLIKKNNNSVIKIDYEYNSFLNHTICVAVTNANNDKEEFHLDPKNRMMTHNYYGYGNEIYKFDDLGQTVYYSDLQKNVMETEYNSFGAIISISKNGKKEKYEVNDKFHTTATIYDDGSMERTFYNELGLITKVIDRDGNFNSYEYDEKGNMIKSLIGNTVCGTYWYYQNGLLKGYSECNKTVEFKYNEFGSVIEKKEKFLDGKLVLSAWKYDSKNRLIEHSDNSGFIKKIEYSDKKEIITSENRKVINLFNNRGLILKQIDEDLRTGEKHIKENVYDNIDNIIKVYTDGALLSEYEYYKNRILKSYTVWNNPDKEYKADLLYGMKTEYLYDDIWQKKTETLSKIVNEKETEKITVVKYTYEKQNGNNIVSEKRYLSPMIIKTYNREGLLIKEESETGYFKQYSYSKAGKLLSEKNSLGDIYLYKYNSDGSYKILYENSNGGQIIYDYNHFGKIIKIKNYYGFSYSFVYDSSGNLISERKPTSTLKTKYDNKNRAIYTNLSDNNGNIISEYSIVFDDKNNTKSILSDGYIKSIEKFNIWGMVIESQGKNSHNFYSYDYMGNCKKITDYYGNETKFEYSPSCKVILEIFPDNSVKKYEYSLERILKNISNNGKETIKCYFDENSFEVKALGGSNGVNFMSDGSGNKMSFYDIGMYSTKKDKNNNYSITDEKNNSYRYEVNKNGQIVNEINPLGEKLQLSYNNNGDLIEKINYSGMKEKYSFDEKTQTSIVEYSTGEEIGFIHNVFGKMTKLYSNDYSLEFEYDKIGNLISEYSKKTDTRINYTYDSFSRCIKKSGNTFSFLYSYDEMGHLIRIEDENSRNWITFEYDNMNRVKNRKYSNGMETLYGYNKYGQLEYYVTRNKIGLFMSGDFLLHDEYGRIYIKADVRGNITKYKYDNKSRLISTEYPYSEEIRDAYLDEATECGYFIIDSKPKINKIELEESDVAKIQQLYEKSGVRSFMSVNLSQDIWKESYDYNENGCIKSVINPYGEIEYKYDSLNRLISKNYKSSNNDGIKLKWNKDNCLEEFVSKKRRLSFYYGALKRPVKIISEDFINGDYEITEYCYDGLGRRVLEKSNGATIENIYDGLSNSLVSRQNITDSNFISSVYNNEENPNNYDDIYRNNTEKKYNETSDYRVVDNNDYTPYGDIKISDNSYNNINKYSYENKINDINRTSYNLLSFGDSVAIISYIDGSKKNNCEAEFLINDYKDNIIGSVNANSDYVEFFEYDTWGTCISGKPKINNSFNLIYNLGYRDYIPLLKTFTTEDPIRAGRNWFSYCPCDSVNYIDKDGLRKRTYTESENLRFQACMFEFINFYETEFHDENFRDRLNCYMGLYCLFDCTDNAIGVCNYSMRKAGLCENDKLMLKFSELYASQNMSGAKWAAWSGDFPDGNIGRKIFEGYDNEYLKRVSNPDYKMENEMESGYYRNQISKQKILTSALKNPCIIQPGSVIVWKNSKYNRTDMDGFPNSCGHVVTVVSREIDNGKVVGFYAIEGHTGGEKTELTYFSTEGVGAGTIHEYYGAIDGIYELESADASKKESICII